MFSSLKIVFFLSLDRFTCSSSDGAISPFITFDYHKSICDKL